MAAPTPTPPAAITLRTPSRYTTNAATPDTFVPPPLDWLHRTWTVTHSTLAMWRSARNVRITYSPHPPRSADAAPRIGDMVEYEAADGRGALKTVAGVDTAAGEGVWDWRGSGWLFFVTSRWEVLGWGERPLAEGAGTGAGGVERWAVTWFAPTLFTKEGVDVYSDRAEGVSEGLAEEVLAALKAHDAKPLAQMCEKDMRPVQISLPWKEK